MLPRSKHVSIAYVHRGIFVLSSVEDIAERGTLVRSLRHPATIPVSELAQGTATNIIVWSPF